MTDQEHQDTTPPDFPATPVERDSHDHGAAYIGRFASRLSIRPGVYRMLDQHGNVLYVGKAKHLKNRVSSYANTGGLSHRIMRMVVATCRMEVVETRNEAEAILLEARLIKKYQPRYNILLKDDKSYPYIRLSNHEYPRIVKHRGTQHKGDLYFGPFPSAGAVRETISLLQRAFLLRPCSDNIFKNRSRPCLEYQIKRCSAPCVGYVSEEEYGRLIQQARNFLEGKSREVQEQIHAEMQRHSEAMEFEKAAACRDRIRVLTQIQEQQQMVPANLQDADVIACHRESGQACVQVWFFRGGQHYGNHAYFPSNTGEQPMEAIISTFIGQFYQHHPIPKEVVTMLPAEDVSILEEALGLLAGHKVAVRVPQKGERRKLMEEVEKQAANALRLRLAERRSERSHLANVQRLFALPEMPERIEVYDNSHIGGTHAVGAMIVAGQDGFDKNSYRRFTIRSTDLSPGDDYAMLREVLTRRLKRLQKEDPAKMQGMWPDLLLIDGGKGQFSVTKQVLESLGVDELPFVCIAKGEDRHAGREWFFMPGHEPFQLPVDDPTLHYLQRLRDEAHRFAINSHRIKRANAIRANVLNEIPGVGAKRRKALIEHFGSAKAVETASLQSLQNTPGISEALASQIYEYFNG